MRRGNCLLWALRQRVRHGGQLRLIHVRHASGLPMPRFLWRDARGQHWFFAPLHRRRGLLAYVHKLMFAGYAHPCDERGRPMRFRIRDAFR